MASEGLSDSSSGGALYAFGPFHLRPAERLVTHGGRPLKLGARAFDILALLVERSGDVVGKDDLIARAWPNVVVGEGALRVQIAGLRRALGDDGAQHRYLSSIPGQGYCFVAPVSACAPLARPAPPSPRRPPHRDLVGRSEAVERIAAQVLERRFVTVVGPGGVGKTAVAASVIERLAEVFPGTICFVDLGPLSDASLLAGAVASALGFRTEDAVSGIIGRLAGQRTLIVLDGCEHVVEAAAWFAEQVIEAAPGAHVLSTSRESLRARGEHVHRLSPLEYPPAEPQFRGRPVEDYPAVKLFLDRARALSQQFALEPDNVGAVGDLCRRLDGLPLAIELAAAQVEFLSVRSILSSLGDRFLSLAQGCRTAVPRQQTLRATLDWSFRLLPAAERKLLCRLATFQRSFTLDAAVEVAALAPLDEAGVIAGVASLVAKSLLVADAGGVPLRYRLLDTTRAYAREVMREDGEDMVMGRRHAVHVLHALKQQKEKPYNGEARPDEGSRAAVVHDLASIDDLRAALRWAFSPEGDDPVAVELAVYGAHLFRRSSLPEEYLGWMGGALTRLSAPGSHPCANVSRPSSPMFRESLACGSVAMRTPLARLEAARPPWPRPNLSLHGK
ncbi:MAG: winged helix-turn-helix domain-containing protein [Caulobacteraceae bacterium]